MIVDPEDMGLETLFVQLCAILAEITWKIDFSIMAAFICILSCHIDTCDHGKNSFIMVADPHNKGLNILVFQLSVMLA